MNIYYVSPLRYKSSYLFDTFTKYIEEAGHTVATHIFYADIVFFDFHTRMFDGVYDIFDLSIIITKQKPVVFFDFWDYGAMNKEQWFGFGEPVLNSTQWEWFYWMAIANCKVVYFMRKMDKKIRYPYFVHPIEVPLLNDFQEVSMPELYHRGYDVCFIGNTSPTRESVVKGFIDDGRLKVNSSLGKPRIENAAWLNEHRKSKFFIESCGGGFGSERMHQLITIAPMIRTKSDQLYLHPFIHGYNCIEVSAAPTKEEITYIKKIADDPRELHSIYLRGIYHMRGHYSERSRANYILQTLKQNELL